MAHEITSTDGMVLAGAPAWHGLGTVVAQAPSTVGALEIAGLGWHVEKWPIRAHGEGARDGLVLDATSHVATVRSDTRTVLGVVGEDYSPLQNRELAELIDSLAAEGAIPRAESAGSLRGGRNVFFLIQTASFALCGDDDVQAFTLFANAHDGTACFRAFGTSVRVCCKNTLNAALRAGERSGVKLRHTGDLSARVRAAKGALGILGKRAAEFQEAARRLAAAPIRREGLESFFAAVYQRAYGPIPVRPTTAVEERARDKAARIIGQWTANMESPRQTRFNTRGTMWAALQSVTDWADHARTVRTSSLERDAKAARVHSNLFGSSAEFKADALELALVAV